MHELIKRPLNKLGVDMRKRTTSIYLPINSKKHYKGEIIGISLNNYIYKLIHRNKLI